jgi:hypothetical protein
MKKSIEGFVEGTGHLQPPEVLNMVRYTGKVPATAGVKTQLSHCNID